MAADPQTELSVRQAKTTYETIVFMDHEIASYALPPDEAKMVWLSEGLKMPLTLSMYQKAGPKAGLNAGQGFYVFVAGKIRLALREDGMVAYICEVEKGVNDEEIVDILKQCNLIDVQIPPGGHIHGQLATGWVQVTRGIADTQNIWTDFCFPGDALQSLPGHTLHAMSKNLEQMFETPDITKWPPGCVSGLSALPGDILGYAQEAMVAKRGCDIFGRYLLPNMALPARPEPGENVVFENASYKATQYGYVLLLDNQLSVRSPLWMDADAVHVYWCLFDHCPRKIEPAHVQVHLDAHQIHEGQKKDRIDHLLSQVAKGEHTCGIHLIAEGIPPQNGMDTHIEVIVDTNRRVGLLRNNGSFDFRQVDYSPDVQPNQEFARIHPPTAGHLGKNVQGKPIVGNMGALRNFKAGKNVRFEKKDGITHVYAETEGVINITRDEIAVLDLLVIEGDINYKTGNLNFHGELFVKGSVGPSFTVSAIGNLTVAGSVESGAVLMSKGNIVVGKGVLGRKTRVIAVGHFQAQYVQDANIQCGRNLYLGAYAQTAYLRAGNRLQVAQSTDPRGGSLIGGQTWSYHSIDTRSVGAPNQIITELNVGVSPDQAQKLEELDVNIQEANKLIVRYLQRFGIERIDVSQIQNILAASTGPRKKVLALTAKQLGQAVQTQQKLVSERKEIQKAVDKNQNNSVIIIREKAMPGTLIRMGDQISKIQEVTKAPRYRIRKNQLINR